VPNASTLTPIKPDASVQRSIDLDLDRIDFYDEQLGKLEWYLKKLSLRQTRDGSVDSGTYFLFYLTRYRLICVMWQNYPYQLTCFFEIQTF